MLIEQDALWEYQFVANAVPADPATEPVPVADWLGPSRAPFGTIGASFATNLPATTVWGLGDGMWVRRALVVDGLSPVLLRGQIENACFVYVDGVWLGTINPANVQVSDTAFFEMVIPVALLSEGVHELAILCLDEPLVGGDTTFFWLTADYLPALIPLWPGPPMSETIGWLNDVQVYENGNEDRERLRNAPRHQYRMTCFVPHAAQPQVVNTLYGARSGRWLIPLWSQVQHVGAVPAGSLELDVLTSYSEYRADSLVLLWQSPSRWQVVGADEIKNANTLTLSSLTEGFEDAWVMPVRKGFLESDPQRAFDGRTSRLSLTMNVEDNAALTVAAPAQFLGNDIYFEPGLLDGDASNETITTKFELLDEALGLVTYSSPWTHSRPSRPHRMMAETPAEAWELRKWLHRRAGRLTPFWHPSFEVDLRVLNVGAVGTELAVVPDDYLRYAAARSHIAVETTAGWLARTVLLADQISADQVTLTLDTALGVQASAIKRVCFLGLRRLNSDRVEINWIGGTVCTAAVPVLDIAP